MKINQNQPTNKITYRGVFPSESCMLTDALCRRRICIIFRLPLAAALCNGVDSKWSVASGSAPFSRSMIAIWRHRKRKRGKKMKKSSYNWTHFLRATPTPAAPAAVPPAYFWRLRSAGACSRSDWQHWWEPPCQWGPSRSHRGPPTQQCARESNQPAEASTEVIKAKISHKKTSPQCRTDCSLLILHIALQL